MGKPRFTREFTTASGDKLAVKILPDHNTAVVFEDGTLSYAASLDPVAAGKIGHALIQAAGIAARNALEATLPPLASDD